MAFLKQHRKATLELDGRKLKGTFEISLTNQGDREVMIEFIAEVRKQMREFNPTKAKAANDTPAKRKKK